MPLQQSTNKNTLHSLIVRTSTGDHAIQKIFAGTGNEITTFSTTFVERTNGSFQYNKSRDDGVDWRGATAPDDNERKLVSFAFFPEIFSTRANTYYVNINRTVTALHTPTHLVVNGREYGLTTVADISNASGPNFRRFQTAIITNTLDRVTSSNLTNDYRIKFSTNTYMPVGNGLIWESRPGPNIQVFNVSPNTIDLDTRATGTITFTLQVEGTTGQSTVAQIVRLPDGTNIGASFVSGSGTALSSSLPNITQPTQTTTYRLFARNDNAQSTVDTTVTVTQNPTISNFRRTGFSQRPDGTRFQFTARITGTPQPVITWRFGNGTQSQRNNDSIHFTPVSGQINTWDVVWGAGAGIIHPLVTDSLVWTVTNSSGSVSSTINNISG